MKKKRRQPDRPGDLSSVWAKDRPPTPTPIWDCAVCGQELTGNVSVAFVVDDGIGCVRFTGHPECAGVGRVDLVADALGIF